jgi:hypothetical protein
MSVSRFYLRGLVIGALVTIGFGAFGATGAAFNLPHRASALILVASLRVVIGLLVASLRLWRRSEALPAHGSPEDAMYWRNSGKWFGLTLASEAALVAIATKGFYKHSDSWTHLGRKTRTNKRAKTC